MTLAEVVIVIPVLRRPQNAEKVLQSIEATTPEPHAVLFVATRGDQEEIRELQCLGVEYLVMPPTDRGDFAKKINQGYLESTEPLIFTGADDLKFYPHWFEKAKAKLGPTIGYVGTNDLGNARVKLGRHSTHSLVRREYADLGTVDEPHKILHEGYPHCYCDDEAVHTAIARRAWNFAKDSVVEHLHYHWGKGPHDDLIRFGEQTLPEGRQLFEQRRHFFGRGSNLPRFHV